MTTNNCNRIISAKLVAELLGVHITTLHRWDNKGAFVPKVRLGPRRIGFLEADVTAWLAQRRMAA